MKLPPFSPGLGVAAFFALVYLAAPTRDYYWDGIAFATKIEMTQTGRDLFSVHHLLYDFVGEIPYKVIGGRIRALYLLQLTNCLAGSVLLWLAYRLFRTLGAPKSHSAACAALIAVSATFWKFTTDADSYILANVLLLATFLALGRSAVRGGLFHAGAIMMHQLSLFFYPVGLVLLWRRSKERFWRDAALYTLVVAGSTVAVYAIAFRLSLDREAPRFIDWISFHADVPFSFKAGRNASWLALGTAKLFVGGKFSTSAWIAGPAAAALLAWGIVGLAFHRGKLLPVLAATPIVLWIAIYAGFLFFWEPQNTFYRLFYLVPLVALLALATREIPVRPLICLVGALACWNFFQFIYPKTRVESNPPLEVALKQHSQWPQGTGVVFADFVPDLWTIHYFNMQATWISIEHSDPKQVAAYKDSFARGGKKLYVDWTYLNRSGYSVPRFTFRSAEDVP